MSSASLGKILEDARWLLNKVHVQESAVDGLAAQAAALKGAIKDNVRNVEGVSGQEPAQTVTAFESANMLDGPAPTVEVTERQRVQQLERENEDLRSSLSEHEYALELIMSKYRQQVLSLEATHKRHLLREPNFYQIEERCRRACTAFTMASVIVKAVQADDSQVVTEQETLAELQYQNRSLRELLKIGHPTCTSRQLEVLIQGSVQEVRHEVES